jgi:hypothetical protein
VIAKLLDYLYTIEYDDISLVETGVNSLELNAKIYVAADFYLITSLKKVAQAKFKRRVTELCGQSKPTDELSELPAIMEYIYQNTVDKGDPGLRETAVKVIVLHAEKLFALDESLKEGLQNLMEKSGAFGRDFNIAVLKKWQGFRKVQCQHCRHIWADPRSPIPDCHCPGCQGLKHNWNDYQVE